MRFAISHSIFRLTFLQTLIFLAAVAVFALMAYVSFEKFMITQVRHEINEDLHNLMEHAERFPVVSQITSIAHRLAVKPDDAIYGFHDGREVFGNLVEWPVGQPDPEGWIEFSGGEGTHINLARIMPLRNGYKLLVGRKLSRYVALRGRLARYLLGVFGAAALIAAFLGMASSRLVMGRVRGMNRVFDRLASGDLEARADKDQGIRELTVLAGYINTALERNARLVDSMRQLSDRIAHELRRPLGVLVKTIEKTDTAQASSRGQNVLVAKAQVAVIIEMFDALLNVAEMEVGVGGNLEMIDLADCIDHAVELYGPMALDKNITLEKDIQPVEIFGVFPLLVQLCANIIENALKYSPEKTTVRVTLRSDNVQAIFSVEDQGGGADPDLLPHISDRFTRAQDQKKIKGHGLGLALVKAIATRHGGNIETLNVRQGLLVNVIFSLANKT